MAVVEVPGYIGSSAKEVTGEEMMSAAMEALGVAVPGMMSEMAGLSMACYVTFEHWIDETAGMEYYAATSADYPGDFKGRGKITGAEQFGPTVPATLSGIVFSYDTRGWYSWNMEMYVDVSSSSSFSFQLDGVNGYASSTGSSSYGKYKFKNNNFSAEFKERFQREGVKMTIYRKY